VLGKNCPIVARQRLGRKVTAVTNTHATIEESLDASFSTRIKESRRLFLPRTSCLTLHAVCKIWITVLARTSSKSLIRLRVNGLICSQ
jgi:hypothetical protein